MRAKPVVGARFLAPSFGREVEDERTRKNRAIVANENDDSAILERLDLKTAGKKKKTQNTRQYKIKINIMKKY